MSHRFYVPVGVVPLAAPPPGPATGDTYFDTLLGSLQTWSGTEWVSGEEIAVQPGPTGPGSPALELWIDPDSEGMTGLSDYWKAWQGTQAEYDAIPSKDPYTLYVVF